MRSAIVILLCAAWSFAKSPADTVSTPPSDRSAFSINFGADLVSRFLWRGVEFGNTWTLQPNVSITWNEFNLYFWNSSALQNSRTYALDYFSVSLSHAFHIGTGTLLVSANDWFSPPAPDTAFFFNFKDNWLGGHYFEATIAYTIAESFPLTATVSHIAYNDPDRPWYVELAYPIHAPNDVNINLQAGGVFGPSGWYKTTKNGFNFINLTATVSKSVVASPSLSIPVSAIFVVNSVKEIPYFIISLGVAL